MKKVVTSIALFFCAVFGMAQSTPTPYIGLQIPAQRSTNWNVPLQYNFLQIDSYLGGQTPVPSFKINSTLSVAGSASVGTSFTVPTATITTLNLNNLNLLNSFITTGAISGSQLGAIYQVDHFSGATFAEQLTACMNALPAGFGGTCDARNIQSQTLDAAITVNVPNVHVYLPCSTITTAFSFKVAAGIRNSNIEGCTYQGGSTASGTAGGTVWVYTGSGDAFAIGDTTFAANTPGYWLHNINLNTAGASSGAVGIHFYRTQELRIDNVYANGDNLNDQTALIMDGTNNYSGGTVIDFYANGFGIGIQGQGSANGGDGMNAATFVKVHIVCPTGQSGTIGINILSGDGNTFSGGDVEQCATMLHLAQFAVYNTFFGVRNESSGNQYTADAHSNNNMIESGTLISNNGQNTAIVDNGTNNSFRSGNTYAFNPTKGQTTHEAVDSTLTDHRIFGIGLGNERGHEVEVGTDLELYTGTYRWTEGFTDGAGTGSQAWVIHDGLANVDRFNAFQYGSTASGTVVAVMDYSGGCYNTSTAPTLVFSGGGGSGAAATANMVASTSLSCNSGSGYTIGTFTITNQGSGYTSNPTLATNAPANEITPPHVLTAEVFTVGGTLNQTSVNSTGTGQVVINGSANAGTGGLIVGSGSANAGAAAATIDDNGQMDRFAAVGSPTTINDEYWIGGVDQWIDERGTGSYALRCQVCTTPTNMLSLFVNGSINLNSAAGTTTGVTINNSSTSGTGGFTVYEGGSNSNVVAMSVSGVGAVATAGNVSVGNGVSGTGNLVVGSHLNQAATADFAGSCTMTTTSCGVGFFHSWSSTPACVATPQGTTPVIGLSWTVGYSGGTATVYASTANTLTWNVICVGNPN